MPHPFLSEAWIDEVRSIRDEYRDAVPPVPVPVVRANLVVTDVPFGDRTLQAHTDTSAGTIEIELGHVADADLTVTLSYDLARVLVIEQRPDEMARAWLLGKIKVSGDLTKLIPTGDPAALVAAAKDAAADPVARAIGDRIKAATATA
jgi:hypothetical protein